MATRLPNFQATWQPAWHADGKPGRPWELLIPSTQILSSLGHLSSSNVQSSRATIHPPTRLESAGQRTGTPPAPPDKTPPVPLSLSTLKGLGLVLHWGEKVLGFFFLKRLNHSKTSISFFCTVCYSTLVHPNYFRRTGAAKSATEEMLSCNAFGSPGSKNWAELEPSLESVQVALLLEEDLLSWTI